MLEEGIIRTKHYEPVNQMVQAFAQAPQVRRNLQSSALRFSMQLPEKSFHLRYLAKFIGHPRKTQKLLRNQLIHINGNSYKSLTAPVFLAVLVQLFEYSKREIKAKQTQERMAGDHHLKSSSLFVGCLGNCCCFVITNFLKQTNKIQFQKNVKIR